MTKDCKMLFQEVTEMKKLMTVSVLVFVLLALPGCGSSQQAEEAENTQIPNPWVDYATLEEAAEAAGFDIAVPDRIEGYPETRIQAVEDSMIQVFYMESNSDDADSVLIRKGNGTEDISGDYSEYTESTEVTMHGVEVSARGTDGRIFTATWTQDGYAYSISADRGMDQAQVEDLVELVR